MRSSGHRSIVSASGITIALALTLVVLAACQPATTTVNPGYRDHSLPYPRVMISEPDLARALVFDEPIVVRDAEGFITSVDLTVRAMASNTFKVDVRGVFKDNTDAQLQPAQGWTTTFLQPNVPERITLRPSGRHAVDYEAHLRWSR